MSPAPSIRRDPCSDWQDHGDLNAAPEPVRGLFLWATVSTVASGEVVCAEARTAICTYAPDCPAGPAPGPSPDPSSPTGQVAKMSTGRQLHRCTNDGVRSARNLPAYLRQIRPCRRPEAQGADPEYPCQWGPLSGAWHPDGKQGASDQSALLRPAERQAPMSPLFASLAKQPAAPIEMLARTKSCRLPDAMTACPASRRGLVLSLRDKNGVRLPGRRSRFAAEIRPSRNRRPTWSRGIRGCLPRPTRGHCPTA